MDVIPLILAFISGAATGVLALHRLCQYLVEETGKTPRYSIAREDLKRLKETQSEVPVPLAPNDPQNSLLTEDLQQQARKTEKDVEELTCSIEEIRQMLAHQHESDAEKLQDQMEVLFSTWSEALREELQLRQDKVIQHSEGEMMAVDIKIRQLNDVSAKLSENHETLESMNASIRFLQVQTRAIASGLSDSRCISRKESWTNTSAGSALSMAFDLSTWRDLRHLLKAAVRELQELHIGKRRTEGYKDSQRGGVRQASSKPESKLSTGESNGVIVDTRTTSAEQPSNWKPLNKRPSINVKNLFTAAKAAKAERVEL